MAEREKGLAELIPTVLDTDPGIDDALALMLAWGSPELDVLALTVVAGTVPLADTARNAARLVAVRRPARQPLIALGAEAPLRRPLVTATPEQHGADGLGDARDWPPVAGPAASPSAAETLVALARAHAEGLTLIALGPLTNLALALRLDADAVRRTGRVVMMAGAVDVPGNITPDAEFNAYVDPDAVREVFDAGLRVDLVPLDATRQTTIKRDQLRAALARRPRPARRLHRSVHGANVPSLGLHAPARPFGGWSCRRREPGAMAGGADRRGRERADQARGRRSELPRGARRRCGTLPRAVPRSAVPHLLVVGSASSRFPFADPKTTF